MSTREFPKRFDFREAEPRIYQKWLDADAFQTAYDEQGRLRPGRADAEPFVIVIPPPNITGRLHMGHALNNTVQDVLIRQKRMDGYDALWVPGTDHAGIATQSVVKKQLDAQGIDYQDLGREEMIRRIWEWRAQFGGEILKQLRRMGCSCDWSRTRFTMDEGLNRAVRHAFVKLYEAGLAYRGKRIVNWCPVDKTALSDDEVDKEEVKAKMYKIRYPFADAPDEHLVIATTRPETLFGDVAVAVNPDDETKKGHIGRKLVLPLQGRVIPIIADQHADPTKGTGAVKITPAHDPNDFEVAQRHGLEPINVMNEDATMNDVVPERYRGLDRYDCRKQALAELEELGLLDSIEDHVMALGRSYRSKAVIEFRLSDQWFVKMQPLAEQALEASGYVKTADGWEQTGTPGIRLHPPRMEKIYFHWLSNIRDWCISRQIWWGHRIPAWYHKETGEVLVSFDVPDQVAKNPDAWRQDDDVLDTWFSSWLWPMSTLGWPEHTPDFQRYYPTSVLSTAKDIIFFWVARMNFSGLFFENRLPYQDVYFHSTIADERGVTMSKSKGNGIDPLSVIDGASVEDLKKPVMEARPDNMKEVLARIEKTFASGFEGVGADGMRWTLIFSITEGEHVRLSLDRFTEGRNFVTKLWNAAGRVIGTLEKDIDAGVAPSAPIAAETDEDHWILARLDHVIRDVRHALEAFDFGAMAQTLYHFVWDEFASWALELSKTRLDSEDTAVRRGAQRAMGNVLADMLRLLHPIIPFVTEELWARLRPALDQLGLWIDQSPGGGSTPHPLLCLERYPRPRREPQPAIEERFAILQRFVIAVRQLRSTSNIKDNLRIDVQVKPLHDDTRRMLDQARAAVAFLARIDRIDYVDGRGKGMAAQYDPNFELYIDLGKYVDLKDEVARLDKTVIKTEKLIEGLEKNLANPGFVERAPPETVEEKRAALADARSHLTKLQATLKELRELVS